MSRTPSGPARSAAHRAGSAARLGVRATARTATAGARTARDHPQAAASGVGLTGVLGVVLAGILLLRVVRSRRLRRLAAGSAERGALGPGVATATRALHLVRDDHDGRDEPAETG